MHPIAVLSKKSETERPSSSRIARRRMTSPGPDEPDERALEICEGVIDVVAALYNVSSKEVRRPGRTGLGVSRVRQIAMYVAQCRCG